MQSCGTENVSSTLVCVTYAMNNPINLKEIVMIIAQF